MLTNYHAHTTFCDGENTPEELVLYALENGFNALGFSGHGYTPFDVRYCMKDTQGYIAEIKRLKEKYKKDIQIYLGVEEDAFAYCNREDFDYIIGSSHYIKKLDKYFPIDSSNEYFLKCVQCFGGDFKFFAENYYTAFCDYILKRKPDIIGHFDVITKYDEKFQQTFLDKPEYHKIAIKYLKYAAQSQCIFEVNTGAIARGIRSNPYPNENLLYELNKMDGKIILSSDCHIKTKLNFAFEDIKKYLYDIGFRYVYYLYNNHFLRERLI